MKNDELRNLVTAMDRYGWPECLAYAGSRAIQYDLWLRHTAWKSMFDPQHRTAAWVCDPGCGSLALSLASDFARVHAYCENPDTRAILEARAAWLGITNIVIEDRLDVAETIDAAAIYGAPSREFLAAVDARLAPHGRLYVGVQGKRGGLDALRALHRLRRRFAKVTPYRCLTTGGLEETYELESGARPENPRAVLAGHSFGFLAAKSATGESLLEAALARTRERPRRLVFASPNGLSVLTQRFVIRVPLDELSLRRNETSRRALLQLGSSKETPRIVTGDTYSIETVVTGTPAAEPVAASLDWITALHQSTSRPCPAGREPLRTLIRDPLRRAFEAFRSPHWHDDFERLGELLEDTLRRGGLPLVFSHGDYSVDNVLLSPDRLLVTGVIDWDLATQSGLPLLDVLYYLATAERARRRASIGTVFREIVFPLRFDAAARVAIDRYCQALSIPARIRPALAVMTWLHHAGVRLENPERYRFSAEGVESGADAFPAALRLMEESAVRSAIA